MVATTVDPITLRELDFDRSRARDYVHMVEQAYDLEADEASWRLEVVAALGAVLAQSSVAIWEYHFSQDFSQYSVRNPILVNSDPRLAQALREASLTAPPSMMRKLYQTTLVSSASEVLGRPKDAGDPRIRHLQPLGICDFFTVGTASLDGSGIALKFLWSRPCSFPNRQRPALQRVMIHIAAARRLRARLRSAPAEPDAAILTPRGKLLHAEDDVAKAKSPREALTEAVKQIAASRGKLRREQPEQALDLWKGLVRGRWSLVERIDTDGKRFLVARKNEEHAPDPRALTLPERRVAGYAALGHANKVIAYELGIAQSTVTRHLASALGKLGLKSKVELASMGFRPAKR